MPLDDLGNVQHFISQMTGTSPSTPRRNQDENPSNLHTDGTEARASPNISGLAAPQNTPATAASSPHLTAYEATNLHNQHVADAFSDCLSTMIGRPLSESIWAPGSARRKPPMLGGTPSDAAPKVFAPIKGVEPIINETFKRMSFQVADLQGTVGENLIGDSNTDLIFSKAPPSFIHKLSAKDVQIPAPTDTIKDSDPQTYPTAGKKENEPPSSKAYLPPHLRTSKDSNHNSGTGTRTHAHHPGNSKGSLPEATAKVTDSSPVKYTIDKVEPKVTTSSAGAKPLTHPSPVVENLENKIFFNAWPKLEDRGRAAAKIRTIIIKDLPRGSTATFVSSLVYGGAIEEINVRSSAAGDLTAVVRFMDAGDCAKYYGETSNGLVWEKDTKGRERVLFVELSKDVDVVGGLLQTWIASGVTRCVRAVGVEADWGMDGLVKIAERKNRKVEKIVDGQNPFNPLWQARSVVFRFCKVEDAVQFKGALARDEEWEHCNIHYAADPCASATGVHLES